MFNFWKRQTKTEHELCQENLSAFLDGRLTPWERSLVERHLQQCSACRADLEALRQTVALLHATPMVKPPRSFLIPVGEVVSQRQVQRRRLAYVYLQAATAAATVLLVLVVSGDILLRYQVARPAPSMLGISPPATMLTESTAVQKGKEIRAPAVIPSQSPELPTVVVSIPSFGIGETQEIAAAPEESETGQAETAAVGKELEAKVMPSQTFARSAAPPLPPTLMLEAEPTSPPPTEIMQLSPIAEVMAAAPTATPQPTQTPIPLMATPSLPSTSVPLRATLSPQPLVGEARDGGRPSPLGSLAFLETLRPILPWMEWVLAATVALLLTATLWLRRKQRLV